MKSFVTSILGFAALAALAGGAQAAQDKIVEKPWGKTAGGKAVSLYTLTNARGAQAKITNYGGIVVSLMMPDRHGKLGDVVLGFDNLQGYEKHSPYFGATIGRYGNRIAKGKFSLDGKHYTLAVNNGVNALHGGKVGFDKAVWAAKETHPKGGVGLALHYVSKDMEEGYPGALTVDVNYTLTDENDLRIEYKATTTKDTVVNLTNHSYFNLNGAGNGDILHHVAMINADTFTPIDPTSIPTGKLESVAGTPFDFRHPTAIGKRISAKDTQIKNGAGYDHNYVLNKLPGADSGIAARVFSPESGRVLTVVTDQPGVQFYTSNFLDGTFAGKGGHVYKKHYAFCLETQHYPDSPNQPSFPTTELKPGETYHSTTDYKFSTE
jgi:aldose 1-epimerase